VRSPRCAGIHTQDEKRSDRAPAAELFVKPEIRFAQQLRNVEDLAAMHAEMLHYVVDCGERRDVFIAAGSCMSFADLLRSDLRQFDRIDRACH